MEAYAKAHNEMTEEPANQRHFRFSLIALLLASCVLLLCAVQGILGYPFRRTIALDRAKFIPVEGYAYSASFSPQYSPWGAQSASARLYENTKVSFLYSQRATSVSRIGKGIFSFPQKGRLLFSASDNSDPRLNGRNYRIEVPQRLQDVGLTPMDRRKLREKCAWSLKPHRRAISHIARSVSPSNLQASAILRCVR
jgi:hypothetical protein